MWVVSTGFNCCFVETREKMQMPTLELEKLGVVDISNDVEALDQTIGGGRSANATVFFEAGTAAPQSLKQNYTIVEGADRQGSDYVSIQLPDTILELANLYRNPGAESYKGTWGSSWVTRADELEFDNQDRITVKAS